MCRHPVEPVQSATHLQMLAHMLPTELCRRLAAMAGTRLNMAGSQCKQAAKRKTEFRRRHSEHTVDTLDQGLQHLSFAKELLDRTWHMASLNPASNLLTRIRPCKASRSCISGLRWHGRTTNIPNRGCELSQEQVQPRVKT